MKIATQEELETILKEEYEIRKSEIVEIISGIVSVLNGKIFISGIEAMCFIIGKLVNDNLQTEVGKRAFLESIFNGISINANVLNNNGSEVKEH